MSVQPQEEGMKMRMGKPFRVILKTLGVIAIVIVLFLAIVFIVDKVAGKSEQGKIEPYGQFVTVDGKKMNVLIQGKGQETVVLLPGYGTAAPALDFKLLIDELSPYYKVVAIEPFGYGLSDETEKERTTENMVNEFHETLQQLHITRYTLMGHSIAGLYGVEYVNKYPDEVKAFVGIDSSVPTQPGMDVKFPLTMFKFLKQSGLQRFLVNVGSDPYASLLFDDKTKEQMKMIMNKNANNNTILNEMKNISSNFKGAQNLTFPKNLPVLLFVQANNTDIEGWIPLHEGQIKDSVHGKVITMDASHYLHHTKFKEITESVREFKEAIK
ncbi:alpha/beta fold hydrolase [Paenibacillus chitinolyticus]|uniref:alpha/beta hydrolase n=1 Tax=Paenibacillus chitinolyticus TaxID=79263 RepID=UPI0038704FB0